MDTKLSTNRILTSELLNSLFNISLSINTFLKDEVLVIMCEVLGNEVYSSFDISIDFINFNNTSIYTRKVQSIDSKKFDGISSSQTRFPLNLIGTDFYVRIYPSNSYLFSKEYFQNQLILIGLDYSDRRKYVDTLLVGDKVSLLPDKINSFDSNAIKVMNQNNNHIGFIKSECAVIYKDKCLLPEFSTAKIIKINKKSIILEPSLNIVLSELNFKNIIPGR